VGSREVNVFPGRDGTPKFAVHATFVVGLDDLACAAFMIGLQRTGYGRARLLRAVDDMVHQYGYGMPQAWDEATDEEAQQAYAAAERLFPEFADTNEDQDEEDAHGEREGGAGCDEADEDGELGADDDGGPVGGGGVEASRRGRPHGG